jgi:hypothetical protein
VISSTVTVEVEITVFPHIKVNVSFRSTQLIVDYNTPYTVNVTKLLCGQTITETIELCYGMWALFILYLEQSMIYYYTIITIQSDAMSANFMLN